MLFRNQLKYAFFCRMALLLNSMLTIGIDHKVNLKESIVCKSKTSEFCIDGQLSVVCWLCMKAKINKKLQLYWPLCNLPHIIGSIKSMFMKYSTFMQKIFIFLSNLQGLKNMKKNHINTDKHKQDNRKKDSPK